MDTLSKAFEAHPIHHPNHIIPLDFSSVTSIPDSHAWSEPEDDVDVDGDDDDGGSTSIIPIIDLMDPNAIEQMGHACEKWGAFRVMNHGIAFGDLEDAEKEVKRLFSLPTEQKLKALKSPGGVTGFGRARISPFFPKFMWHEGYTIIGSPSHDAKKIWPNDYARFCDAMENFEKQMRDLAERVAERLMKLLDISEEKREWVRERKLSEAVQLNFYPSCPEPNRVMGMAPHTDTSFLTIIHQSQTNGLQIMEEGKGWVKVQHHPNTMIVHTGDILHIMSNGRFRSPLHRVRGTDGTQNCYSMAYFYSPPIDYLLSPSVTAGLNARYRDVTLKEYFAIKAKYFGDALSFITLSN